MGLRTGGPDIVTPPNTTEGFLLSGRIFPVAIYGFFSVHLGLYYLLLRSGALKRGPACSFVTASTKCDARDAVGPLGALGENRRAK